MRNILIAAVLGGCLLVMPHAVQAVTVTYQPAASEDDTYCTATTNYPSNSSLPWATTSYNAFVRWQLDIPAGATIQSAYVKIKAAGSWSGAMTGQMQLLDYDSCPSLSASNPYSWSVTGSTVEWSIPDITDGQWYTSPDVSAIVQGFVDRGGYASGNYLGLRSIRYSDWSPKLTYQWDNGSHADGVQLEVTYTTNVPPVANAGSDQEVTDSNDNGYETVTLDGSGSSDSDGTISSWIWKEGATQIATGETADVSLAVGTHTITLVVTDDDSDTDEDTVQVIVNEPVSTTVEYQPTASEDDTYCTATTNYPSNSSLPWATTSYNAFVRWQLDIPAGATIQSAYVKIKAAGSWSGTMTGQMQLLDYDSCPSLSASNPYSWSVTGSTVEWSIPDITDGQWYTSPDVSAIVQGFIDRGSYASGNYLGLRSIRYSDWSPKLTYQWDNGSHTDGVKLEVTYATGGGGNIPPVADAGSDQGVTDSDNNGYETVTLNGSGSSDSDGTITSWVWKEGATQIATGETADVSLAVGTHTITLVVTDDDSDTHEDACEVTVSPYVNQPPVADAGSNQEVTDHDGGGSETVTLNGSGSYDSDGTISSWVWKEGATQIAAGETVQVSLTVGTHTITLVVTDDDSDTDDSTVEMVVNSNPLPVANAGSDQEVTDTDNSGWETVTLDGTGSTDGGGWISSYVWKEGATQLATGSTADVSLAVGTHTITLVVTDNGGATDDDTVEVIVGEPTPKTLEFQTAASADDTYCTSSSNYLANSTMTWWYTTDERRAFARWESIIPAGATVQSAYVKVKASAASSNSATLQFQLLDYDDCPDFSTNPYSWTVTGTTQNWEVSTLVANQWYTSPDISSIVQAFIDRAGYEQGNHIGLRAAYASGSTAKLAYQWDGAGHADGPILVVTYLGGNMAPVADAGEDQVVTDIGMNGVETVTLDGSGSYDIDGSITSWVWEEGATQIATGETATADLTVGMHTVTLVVTDNDGVSETDDVVILVRGNEFYVDFDGGNDNDAGTSTATAWKHCPGDPNATGVAGNAYLLPGDTVFFKGGVVYRGAISCDWSGAEGQQIVYDGNTAGTWGTGKAIIDGSEPMTGWTQCTSAAEAGGNPNWANIWYAYAPEGTTAGSSNLYQFNSTDQMCWLAQDPNPSDPFFPDDVNDWYTIPQANMTTTSVTDSVHLNQSDPNYWDGASVMLWTAGNKITGENITSFDPDMDTITFAETDGPNAVGDGKYTLYNSIHLIDTAGEYYFNDTPEGNGTHKIWLWPPAGNPNTNQVTVSTKLYGFAVDYSPTAGRSYITIQGFTIRKCSGEDGNEEGQGVRILCYSSHDPHVSVNVLDCCFTGIRVSYLGCHDFGRGVICAQYLDGGTFSGNEIFECPHVNGIMAKVASDIVIEGNLFNRPGHVGIWFADADDSQILDNVLVGYNGCHADGIVIYSWCEGVEVSRNYLRGKNTGIGFDYGDDVTVSYNEIHVDSGGFYALSMWKPMTNLRLYNNTARRDDGKTSINHNPGCTSDDRNNISYVLSGASLTPDANNNLTISLALEPYVFADPANSDYHPLSTSPARNAAQDLGFSLDLDGTAVPQEGTPDIGCYEYMP